ncbi:MAG: hypothetical protein JWM81_849 [Candidatus Saccharibacteria bacterium]|nr:hypothetical protein [Candidatus Saccharibacteria bacterium]
MTNMVLSSVYAAPAMEPRMDEVVTLYQNAFASAPWNERTKCAIDEATPSCPGGFSPLSIGQLCMTCDQHVTEPAYTEETLRAKFKPGTEGHGLWYVEETAVERKIVLAAFARITTIGGLAETVFGEDDAMQSWILERNPDPTSGVLWVEDVFADTTLRPSNNLYDFDKKLNRLARGSSVQTYMFQTLNPKLVRAAQRDFASRCKIADPLFKDVPNRSMVVTIERPTEKPISDTADAQAQRVAQNYASID